LLCNGKMHLWRSGYNPRGDTPLSRNIVALK